MIAIPECVIEDPVWESVADIFTPRQRQRPSDWAEQHITLKDGTTPVPGPFRCDYVPWTRPMLDVLHDEPWKEGWVAQKGAQLCVTVIALVLVLSLADQEGGPIGFATTTHDQAKKFSDSRVEPMIEGSRRLRRLFLQGRSSHETRLYKPFSGGSLSMFGTNSSNQLISNPFRWFVLDEEDQLRDFEHLGSARAVAEKRLAEYATRVRTAIISYAHPTTDDKGVALTYRLESDQREWMLRCPHEACGQEFAPSWSHVKIEDRDPGSATYLCPHCAKAISDSQRWAASMEGRFVSTLPPEIAIKRKYAGFHISALCHPRITLQTLAAEYVACVSESQYRVFFNMRMGEPYTASKYVMTEEKIRAKEDPRRLDRSCPSNTVYITCGVDVQKGGVLYYRIDAWTRNGNCVVLEIGRVQGWAALDNLLRTFTSQRGTGPNGGGTLRIAGCGIDYGFLTREVYDFCRLDHGGVPCIPMKHQPGVRQDDPIRYKKTFDPNRLSIGALTRLELCREVWMGRQLGRFDADPEIGGSIVLPLGVSDEFINHMKANHLVEEIDDNGHAREFYRKEPDRRDDWMQCGVYSEVIAVHGPGGMPGIDKLHELPPEKPTERHAEIREGLVQREARSEGRAAAYGRGRREGGNRRRGHQW